MAACPELSVLRTPGVSRSRCAGPERDTAPLVVIPQLAPGITRALAVPLICGLVAGCAVGPDYVKPKVDTPQEYRFAEKDVQDTANTEWWKQFDDPVLDQLIAEALANNKNVKIAAANVEQAAGALMQTRSQFFPQVNYSASATRQRASEIAGIPLTGAVIKNPSTTYEALAGASWEIDLWGRIRRLTEAARANLLATEQARRGVVLSLVAQVASTYLQLRGLDAQLEISNRTLASYAKTVQLFELQYKYGQVPRMNVEQARSSYETAASQIPQIESQIAQTEDALSVLLGRNPSAIPRGKSIDALSSPPVPAGLPSQLLERRPDIAQAEQIFTGGAIKGQVAQATAAQKAELLNYELTIQNAFADVDNSLVARQKLLQQQAAQERLVKALSEYERLATLQYKGGVTPYSTVLQAQQGLFPQELSLAQTRFAAHNALVNLYKATGGGWVDIAQNIAEPPPAKASMK